MGRIFRDLRVFGNKGSIEIKNVLLDGGATRTIIRRDKAEEICDITPFIDIILSTFF